MNCNKFPAGWAPQSLRWQLAHSLSVVVEAVLAEQSADEPMVVAVERILDNVDVHLDRLHDGIAEYRRFQQEGGR